MNKSKAVRLAMLIATMPAVHIFGILPEATPVYSIIPQEVMERMTERVADLKASEAAIFYPGLTFPQDEPVLMLITDQAENRQKRVQRRAVVVESLSFLFEDTGFARAYVCIVKTRAPGGANDDGRPAAVTNYEVKREAFTAAAKKSVGEDDEKRAVARLKGDAAKAEAVCAELGIQ